jgi:superfamily I DNA and/or RNA helicase
LPESDIELNNYQRMALIWADSADDVVCIHGPPGTGKTRTLTAYVKYVVSEGKSVLVTAHSNQAVDNLLVGDSSVGSPEEGTLHAFAQSEDSDLSIARIGNNSRNTVVENNYRNQPIGGADIVAATTSGAAQFDPNTFDVAVVDEATHASRPATAIALNSAKKLVLAGDHKQLPPYCADETMQEEDMHISLFEYLLNRYDDQISVLLKKQYRMNAEIAAFPNEAFYNGDLESADENRDWSIDDLKPLIGVDIDGSERQPEYGHSYYNLEEAEAVAKQVKLLVKNGVSPEDIGVITAYSGQIGHIGSRVNRLDIDNPRAVSIDTVDSFQGSEREAVIVSFVRSNPAGNCGFLEFPEEGPRRLNVAITRSRKRLVLVGNWDTLGTIASHRSPSESCANLYSKLSEHIRSKNRMLSSEE